MIIKCLTRLVGVSALALLGSAAVPGIALAQPASVAASWQSSVADFHYERRLWTRGGLVSPAATTLLDIIERAHLDGMKSNNMVARDVRRALAAAEMGDAADLDAAEDVLSQAWVHYVQTLRRPVDVGMVYGDRSLAPATPSADEILAEAAAAASLREHLLSVSRVNPLYAQLREGLAAMEAAGTDLSGDSQARQLAVNLDRARALPSGGRYVLVDAAAQRLYLYEDGKAEGSMKVIVGKPSEPTPMLASTIRKAIVNPYWNVPPDLVRKLIAPRVLKQGVSYLADKKYEILSDWSEQATVVDPSAVDWKAVQAGDQVLRVRQLPWAGNSMGQIKFMFPNKTGIYLHDTPEKALFQKASRNFSSGCVRVEDPHRLARWLFGDTPEPQSDAPEQSVPLPEPVRVFITYLTATWDGTRIASRPDVYGRDRTASAHMAAND